LCAPPGIAAAAAPDDGDLPRLPTLRRHADPRQIIERHTDPDIAQAVVGQRIVIAQRREMRAEQHHPVQHG
jgi:hypothetical protein